MIVVSQRRPNPQKIYINEYKEIFTKHPMVKKLIIKSIMKWILIYYVFRSVCTGINKNIKNKSFDKKITHEYKLFTVKKIKSKVTFASTT